MIRLLILCLILLPALAIAAPAVTGITGTISNGQSVTISGTDFGATGPTIILFDDFSGGTNGNYIGAGEETAAVIGSWENLGEAGTPTYYSKYTNAAAHSGSMSIRQVWADSPSPDGGAMWVGAVIDGPITQVYFQLWTMIPAGSHTPGGSWDSPNWKIWWLQGNAVHADDYASECVSDPPSATTLAWVDGTQNRICFPTDCASYEPISFTLGRWIRFEGYLTASTSAGYIGLWLMDSGQARHLVGQNTGRTIDNGSSGWNLFRLPGYARHDDNAITYYDDIYLATGTGARARVEICNNATYTSATNCAIATPTSWGATSIAATVRQGSFGASDNAYLFVIDSSGAASSGYAVQFGAGGETPAARKLQNVTGNRVSLH